CKNPIQCKEATQRTLSLLQLKWDPRVMQNLREVTKWAKGINGEPGNQTRAFDHDTELQNLAEGIQVLTKCTLCEKPASRGQLIVPNGTREPIVAYTDGSCWNNGDENAIMGSGIWYGHGDPRNLSMQQPECFNTDNAGEIAAILI
ncbi:hypothetical protein BU17DRAFT_11641, partial [Hysterangium stoloniferum]